MCLFLGSYGSLTTRTAATLFLHPQCQVLEHCGNRVFNKRDVDFLSQYTVATFTNFVRYAMYVSQCRWSEESVLKTTIKALVWKEPLRTSQHIRKHSDNLDYVFAKNKFLRFIVPICNPMDCAMADLPTAHAQTSERKPRGAPIERTIEAIIDELAWINRLRQIHPQRYFVFFENDFSRQTLIELAVFLGLSPTEQWCTHAVKSFARDKSYIHNAGVVSFYRVCVTKKFTRDCAFKDKLLRFAPAQAVV